jgi:hypothetical protein
MVNAWRTFSFRVLLASSWGIAIDLKARERQLVEEPVDAIRVSQRTWLDVSGVVLPTQDIAQIRWGIAQVAPEIEAKRPLGHTLIEIGSVDYRPTDYQAEGMAAAIIGWVSEQFDLEPPNVAVGFDPMNNRYVFDW